MEAPLFHVPSSKYKKTEDKRSFKDYSFSLHPKML